MTDRESYAPGSAAGAEVEKNGETWTLVLVRDLRHPPERVWPALVDPAELAQWAPFDADGRLDQPGAIVKLTTVGAPTEHVTETRIKCAEPPRRLEYDWGGAALRFELEPRDGGARLKIWHSIDRRYIAMGAAGWHICLDVLDLMVAGEPIGRIVGAEAMKFEWPRLNAEYSRQFGVEPPKGGGQGASDK